MNITPLEVASPEALTRLTQAFASLDGQRILITGGTGFVGKWLLETGKFVQMNSNHRVEIVAPARRLDSLHAIEAMGIGCPGVTWVEGDLLHERLDIGEVDMIIHAATPADAALNESNPKEMLRINTDAMKAALSYAGNNQPFLFTSSGAVYGAQPPTASHMAEGTYDSSIPADQLSAYAIGKRMAEELCHEAAQAHHCRPIIARMFAFGGEYLPKDTHFAIGNFIKNALEGQPISIKGDGRSRRSYIYGADMAIWLWSALSLGQVDEPLHIGSEQSLSILDLAHTVAQVSGEVFNFIPKIIVSKFEDSAGVINQYVPSTIKTQVKLSVSDWTSLHTIIRNTMVHAST